MSWGLRGEFRTKVDHKTEGGGTVARTFTAVSMGKDIWLIF